MKSLAVIAAVLCLVLVAALIFSSVRWGHDAYYSRQYESSPSINKDNTWGGIAVNIVINEKTIKEPESEQAIESCKDFRKDRTNDIDDNEPGGIDWGQVARESTCSNVLSNADGSVYLKGEVNVKNTLWSKSTVVPSNLLSFKADGREAYPQLKNDFFGRYINPGQGYSSEFEYRDGYSARDFELYLNDDNRSTKLIEDATLKAAYR